MTRSYYQFECDKCGSQVQIPDKHGQCPVCGILIDITWPIES